MEIHSFPQNASISHLKVPVDLAYPPVSPEWFLDLIELDLRPKRLPAVLHYVKHRAVEERVRQIHILWKCRW